MLHQHSRADRTVVLTGGVRTPSDALVGPVAVATLGSLHLDMVFMGVHGISERAGFTTPNLMEAETNRAFIASTEHLVVLADHTKWNVTGLSSIAPLASSEGAHLRSRRARRSAAHPRRARRPVGAGRPTVRRSVARARRLLLRRSV